MVPAMRRHAPAVRRQPLGSAWSRAYIIAHTAGTDLPPADLPFAGLPDPGVVQSRRPRACKSDVRDAMDPWAILFLALAVVIFWKLRSVLGQRTGRERPPYDPYSARDAVRGATNDNVVTLPGRGGTEAAP